MNNDNTSVPFLQSWKIWAGVLIGLLVVIFLFLHYLNSPRFILAPTGSGTHEWIDANHNGKVDFGLESDFTVSASGNYRKEVFADVLKQINWSVQSLIWLSLAFLFMALRDVFYMIRIRTLTGHSLTWGASFHVIMLWEFASALSPGVMSGAAVAMFILKKERIPLGKATAAVMVTAILDNLFFILLIPVVFFLFGGELLFPSGNIGLSSAYWIFWGGFSIITLLFLFFFITLFIYPRFIKVVFQFIFSIPLFNRWKVGALKTAEEIQLSSVEMKGFRSLKWLKIIGSTFASWISRFFVINFLLAAFVPIYFKEHLLVFAKQFILWLFMRMSPTPGGSGLAEYAFGELMAPFGKSAFVILGLAFLWRILSYYSYLIIGAIILPRWLRKKL
ncbi:MAG: YbhN family protein [Flavobacteriia bacterium]|jgi:uncharacterized protein (TIRG00374 family)